MASSSTAVNLPTNCCYEVFLNHRGSDTKKNIASHIYRGLVKQYGFRVFWDKEEMQVGDDLTCQIKDAINTASVHVAIFSPHYAESKWCLEELHLMVQSGKPIIPVFYKIEPGELKRTQGEGVYAEALRILEQKTTHDSQLRYNSATIGNWRAALSRVAEISGLELEKFNGDEGDLVDAVVDSVSQKLRGTRLLDVAEHPTGLDEQIEDFEKEVLSVPSDKARVIGIVGMGGIGKTTLVKELFNRKQSKYSKSCFLEDVRENERKASLESLQEKLLEGLTLKYEKIKSKSAGIELLKTRLASFEAMVILDDVDDDNQLDALLRPIRDVLHSNSLILITSRDTAVLRKSSIYTLSGLNPQHSKELFCLHAFTQPHPLVGFEHLVDKFLKACNGLPLSLKVFGSLLYGNDDKSFWEAQLGTLDQQKLPADIKTHLQVSYDLLQDDEKQMFLDIACFFIGESRDKAIRIWKGCGLTGSLGFRTLQNKSLVEVDSGVDPSKIRIRMHDHLRDLGRDLAKDKGLPRRIWRMKDLEDLLQQPSGVTDVRGISVTSWTGLEGPSFSRHKMRNLRFLDIRDDQKPLHASFYTLEGLTNAVESSNLIWLRVSHFVYWPPQISMASRIPLMKLRVLEANRQLIGEFLSALGPEESQLPVTFGDLAYLEHLNLSSCYEFKQFPDTFGNLANLQHLSLSSWSEFMQLPQLFGLEQLRDTFGNLGNLQHLDLSGCRPLKQLPDTFGNLGNLQHLNLSRCWKLKLLPDTFGNLGNLQHLNLSHCDELKQLPDTFGNLGNLQHLHLSHCHELKQLPDTFGNLGNLQHLCLSTCSQLKQLPDTFGNLGNLQHLDLMLCFELKQLPDTFGNLGNLQHLNLSCGELKQLPDTFGNLGNLQHLDLSACRKLKQLPDTFGNLGNLQHLELSWKLEQLPDTFGNLGNLQHLALSNGNGRLKQLPDTFGNLGNLQHLELSACRELKQLPDTFGNLGNLQHLKLSGCWKLKQRPDTFGNLGNLQDLDLSDCRELKQLPIPSRI